MNKPPRHLHQVPSVHTDEEPPSTPLSAGLNEPPSMEEIQAMVEAAAWELRVVAGACAELSQHHIKDLSKLLDTIATLIQTIADDIEDSLYTLQSDPVDSTHSTLLIFKATQNDLLYNAIDLLAELFSLYSK